MWSFYRTESELCALKLTSLHDTSASSRHKLHRKLGGPASDLANHPSSASFQEAEYSSPIGAGGLGVQVRCLCEEGVAWGYFSSVYGVAERRKARGKGGGGGGEGWGGS